MERIPVLLSTDVGAEMDDQWALSHLCLSPRVEVLGVVTTHTPYQTAQRSAQVALEVLEHLPLRERPLVVPGSSAPLPSKEQPLDNEGVRFLIETIQKFPASDRLTVLTIGATTDLASAWLQAPQIADRIRVVSMAFYDLERGGHEFNVQNDPKAWQVLLDAPIDLTIGCAAVCLRDLLMTVPRARSLFGDSGEAARYLIGLLEWWLDTQPHTALQVTGREDAWPVWDECVTAYLLGWAQTRQVARPHLLDNLLFEFSSRPEHPYPYIQWIDRVDADQLWDDLAHLLRSGS